MRSRKDGFTRGYWKRLLHALIAPALLAPMDISAASPQLAEEIGAAVGFYYGSCLALQRLKQQHCPKMVAPKFETCMNDIKSAVPSPVMPYLEPSIAELKAHPENILQSIDKGFAKTLNMTSGDKEKACIAYGSSLATVKHQKLEQLRTLTRLYKQHLKDMCVQENFCQDTDSISRNIRPCCSDW